jgi:5-methylcytosine-specific restriction endonuclease McrA
MFVDRKSIKWEVNGRRVTARELLGAVVWREASLKGDSDFVEFSAEELANRIWNGNLPTPEEIDGDGEILALFCSSIRRGLPLLACYYCGANRQMGEAMHTDHVRPRSCGVRDTTENTVRACKKCNLRKSDSWLGQFRGKMAAEYGFERSPTFFGELPEVRRVLRIETQTAKARHPNLKPAEDHPLTRMGTTEE